MKYNGGKTLEYEKKNLQFKYEYNESVENI